MYFLDVIKSKQVLNMPQKKSLWDF